MVERDEIRASCGPHDRDRERSLPLARTSDARAQVGTVAPLSPRATMKRKLEFHFERQWELYRLSVAEGMPDSAYKTAVLAGIAHKLKMLDRMEAASLG